MTAGDLWVLLPSSGERVGLSRVLPRRSNAPDRPVFLYRHDTGPVGAGVLDDPTTAGAGPDSGSFVSFVSAAVGPYKYGSDPHPGHGWCRGRDGTERTTVSVEARSHRGRPFPCAASVSDATHTSGCP